MASRSKRTYSMSSDSSPSVPSPSASNDSAIDSCGGTPPPEHSSQRKRKPIDKQSDQYRARRERNNEAVRRSRLKSKVKREMLDSRVRELIKDKADLQLKVDCLEKELQLIRSWVIKPEPVVIEAPPAPAKALCTRCQCESTNQLANLKIEPVAMMN